MPSDILVNLISGFVGSALGAIATLVVAREQLKVITDNHKEAMTHQNEIIERTFKNQIALQAAEMKRLDQLDCVSRLHIYISKNLPTEVGSGVSYIKNWKKHFAEDKAAFAKQLDLRWSKAAEVHQEIFRILKEYQHHWEIHESLRDDFNLIADFINPCKEFVDAIKINPNSEEPINLEQFANKVIDGFMRLYSWVDRCDSKSVSFKSMLLEGEEIQCPV
jgi:hypothetical protein